jgi:hypothetical protein
MFWELPVPFDETKFPPSQLEEVNGGPVSTAVSVNCSGVFISLNFTDLKAGDIILYREQAEDRFDPIVAYQLFLHESLAARWRHVGILDGQMLVWDAMPKLNVRCRPLRDWITEPGCLSFFRPKCPVDPMRLGTSLLMFSNYQWRIFRLDTGGQLVWRLLRRVGAETGGFVPPDNSVVCSTFVSSVLRRATQQPFFRSHIVVTPADFADDEMFEPVAVAWRRVV